MIGKQLGKISGIHIGYGGYQDAMLGITFDLRTESGGFRDFRGYWANRPDYAAWTQETQETELGRTLLSLGSLLEDAGVNDAQHLINAPVEVTTNGNIMISWRILKEVL